MEANECLLSHGKRLQQRRRAAGSFYRWVAVAVGVGFNNTGSGPLKDVYFQCILSGGGDNLRGWPRRWGEKYRMDHSYPANMIEEGDYQ